MICWYVEILCSIKFVKNIFLIFVTKTFFQIFNKQCILCFFWFVTIKFFIKFEKVFNHKLNFFEIFVNSFLRNSINFLLIEKFIFSFSKIFFLSCICIEIFWWMFTTKKLKTNFFFQTIILLIIFDNFRSFVFVFFEIWFLSYF